MTHKWTPTITSGEELLYTELAWIWRTFSPPPHYIEEATIFANTIRKHSSSEVKTLLNLGTGGGHLDYTLKNHFEVTGVDISPEMLKQAENLNPEVRYIEGDMRSIRIEETFDAVLIHDSINYMLTEDDLKDVFKTAYNHLKPEGLMLTLIEEEKENFKQNRISCTVRKSDDVEIISLENDYDPDPTDNIYETHFIYIIRQAGKQEIYHDLHIMGIFNHDVWLRILKDVGFSVTEDRFIHSSFEEGEYYPILVCQKV